MNKKDLEPKDCIDFWTPIFCDNKKECQQVSREILKNQELRAKIVDMADLWDGEESSHYGGILLDILNGLGIKDTPEFYKKDNIDKFLKDIH